MILFKERGRGSRGLRDCAGLRRRVHERRLLQLLREKALRSKQLPRISSRDQLEELLEEQLESARIGSERRSPRPPKRFEWTAMVMFDRNFLEFFDCWASRFLASGSGVPLKVVLFTPRPTSAIGAGEGLLM